MGVVNGLFIILGYSMDEGEDMNELIEQIQGELKGLKEKVETARQMKGKKRMEYIQRVRDRDFKRIKTYINHLQTTINFNQHSVDQSDLQQQRGLVEKYKAKLEKLMKKLQSSKNDVMTEAVLFEQRIQSKRQVQAGTDRNLMIKQIDQAQLQSEQAVRRALKNMYQMQGISQGVNVQLQRQLNQLDSIYETLQDTESSMNRAIRHINYFARSVYTDKILMVLIVLIIIAIVVIVILTSMGKIPSAKQDSLF